MKAMSSKGAAGQLQREILKLLKEGLLSSISEIRAGNPNSRYFLDVQKRKQFKRALFRLEAAKMISLGGEKIEITKKGEAFRGMLEVKTIGIKESEWDNNWHLIAYDIPQEMKKQRDFFRRKLKELNFYYIQESLWAYTYECKEEVAILAQWIGVAPFVIYLTTNHLPEQSKMCNYYHL